MPTPPDDALPEDPKLRKLANSLRGMCDAAGVEQPEETLLSASTLNVGPPKFPQPPQLLSARVSQLLQGRNLLFRRGHELGKVNGMTGKWEAMSAEAFCTWLPNTAGIHPISGFHKESGAPMVTGMGVGQARLILASDDVRNKMPVIEGINHVKMPVFREAKDGKEAMELLSCGYDAPSKIFTTFGGPDFDEKMEFKAAVEYLWQLFRFFAWRNPQRDWPIVLAGMVTMFGRGLYRGKAPAFIVNANIQASGKSRIGQYICWVVHNTNYTRPLLEDSDEKLQDTLETAAKAQKPYVLFDNVDWGNKTIIAPLLDEWITSHGKEFRIKGVSEDWEGGLRAVTLLTGNNLKLSDDLQRRSLMADLWNPLAAEERPPLPKDAVVLNDKFFLNPKNRDTALAALWSICRHWDLDGRPAYINREYASFEDWSLVIPEVVAHAGRCLGQEWNCMLPPENPEIGNKRSVEYKDLARRAIAEFGLDPEGGFREVFEVSVANLAGVARRYQVATEKLWPEMTTADVRSTENDKGGFRAKSLPDLEGDELEQEIERQASEYLSPKTRSSFGTVVKNNLNERQFLGPDGYYYEFRAVQHAAPARYRVSRVKR